MKGGICVILLSRFVSSCINENRSLEYALDLAGDNRKEQENVVKVYRKIEWSKNGANLFAPPLKG